ncbi:hypothetical protein R8Z50_11270 [Longispora sp. K20-0274]|uniref:hypothetical protein n=1 Tax=Longispora sp. K20-0274 TaxID=3088255 RepID=UPI003999FEFF
MQDGGLDVGDGGGQGLGEGERGSGDQGEQCPVPQPRQRNRTGNGGRVEPSTSPGSEGLVIVACVNMSSTKPPTGEAAAKRLDV